MAFMVTYTSLLVTAIAAILVLIPTVVGQAQCKDGTKWAYENSGDYITSPGYPSNYPSNLNCRWLIKAYDPSSVVVLELSLFYLEGPQPDCPNDYVEIYDGPSTSSPRTQLLCGQASNKKFTSTGSSMTVVFHSDGSDNFIGFRFVYSSQKPVHCTNDSLEATGVSKYITSPGYPSNYPSFMDCKWVITADSFTSVVMLKLLDFYLGMSQASCPSDYVAIYDGDSTIYPRIKILCGQVLETQFTSSGSSMTVVFRSDGRNNFRGFKFEYTSLDKTTQCRDGNLEAIGAPRYITSPGYPNNYPNFVFCKWVITADSSLRVVMLKLLDFYLDGTSLSSSSCTNDYVAIYDGDTTYSSIIQYLCGQVPDTQFTSTGSSMTIEFNSDGRNNNFRGFKFEYTSQDQSAVCSDNTLVATGDAKYITSPRYPKNYPSYVTCQWVITADSPSNIVVLKQLDFSMDGPPCTFDSVTIYDGNSPSSPRIQLLCGYNTNKQLTSSGPSMTVVFRSNVNDKYRGFKFEYTSQDKSASCSDVTLFASATDNYLTSPNYPDLYLSKMDCEWHISTGSSSTVVAVSYSQFNLPGTQPDCTDNYVKIYDGPSTASPLIKVMCAYMHYGTFASTNSEMTIVFHSDGGDNNYYKTGFKFSYHSQKKGQKSAGYGFDNTSSIAVIVTSSVAVPIILVVLAICLRRRIARRQLRNTTNMVSRPREATGRANSLFIVSLWASNGRATPSSAGIDESQSSYDPPSYSSINCNVGDNLPAYTPRSPGYNINDLPPPYSNDLPGGTAELERSPLLQETLGAHINEAFNFTNRDEIVSGHMTGQNVSADFSQAREANKVLPTVPSCPPSYSVGRDLNC